MSALVVVALVLLALYVIPALILGAVLAQSGMASDQGFYWWVPMATGFIWPLLVWAMLHEALT